MLRLALVLVLGSIWKRQRPPPRKKCCGGKKNGRRLSRTTTKFVEVCEVLSEVTLGLGFGPWFHLEKTTSPPEKVLCWKEKRLAVCPGPLESSSKFVKFSVITEFVKVLEVLSDVTLGLGFGPWLSERTKLYSLVLALKAKYWVLALSLQSLLTSLEVFPKRNQRGRPQKTSTISL